MKLRKAWQAMSDDNGGIGQIAGAYFWVKSEAEKHCDGWGKPPAPKEHDMLVDDEGRAFPLSAQVKVYEDSAQLLREVALSKLTPSERKALGF